MSLEQMRKLLAAKNHQQPTTVVKPRTDTSIYQHWLMPLNMGATVRFLPDADAGTSG
jgi:hypothetical protein